jgi:hypothetical protein
MTTLAPELLALGGIAFVALFALWKTALAPRLFRAPNV